MFFLIKNSLLDNGHTNYESNYKVGFIEFLLLVEYLRFGVGRGGSYCFLFFMLVSLILRGHI